MSQQLSTSARTTGRLQCAFTKPSLTKQSFKKECDINTILARYQKTGLVTHIAQHAPHYGEASSATFNEAMQTVANATSMFNELPSRARAYFEHDPARFLDYIDNLDPEDEKQTSLLSDLGLAHAPQSDPLPTPPGVPPVINEPAAPAAEIAAPGAAETAPNPQ